jgi:hypothetical protein
VDSVRLRLAASVLALAAGASGIVVAVLLLRSVPGPAPTSTTPAASSGSSAPAPASIAGGRIATPNYPAYPSPPPGAVVLAREADVDDLGLAIAPDGGKTLVRVSVVDGNIAGVRGLDVRLALGTQPAVRAAACGAGCYQATFASTGRHLNVSLGSRTYGFAVPAETSDGSAIVSHAEQTWRSLKTLVWHERLGSSPTEVLRTVYKVVAPNELQYTIQDGSAAIIIGGTRWDRSSRNGGWLKSVQEPELTQPRPFWVDMTDAEVVAAERFEGHPVWRVTFFDPATPGWFAADIEKGTYRTLELDMIAAAHFMHHVYGPFDAPIRIEPPT